MRNLISSALCVLCLISAPVAIASFDWGGSGQCSGSGNFEQSIDKNAIVTVGDIPAYKQGVYIKLTSANDIDVQLYDKASGKKIVHWPEGVLSGPGKQTTHMFVTCQVFD